MPFDVVWSDKAIDDINALASVIAQDSPAAANSYIATIYKKLKQLRDFPESGRRYGSTHRVVVVRNHLVIYRFDQAANEVRIITIVDGRRDLVALLSDLPH